MYMRSSHRYQARRRREPFPSPKFWLRFLDVIVYIAGILGPLATLPQLYDIYSRQDAAGVSLLTWIMYAVFDLPWVIYAIVHKEGPLIVCYGLWFTFNVLVVIGVLLYGNPWTI
jgi:MtN3 and saliva related transmembrane protein